MSRLIEIPDELPFDIYDKEHANEHFMAGIETMKEWIKNQPTVDAFVVTRCEDCKFGGVLVVGKSRSGEETYAVLCCKKDRLKDLDDFCLDGKRKEREDAAD